MKKVEKKINKKEAQKIFYKTNPMGGISLIVLVITIIVVIILAAAVIISLQNNNPMVEANKARIKSDVANMQAIFTNTVGKIMAENQDVIQIEDRQLNSVTTGKKKTTGEATYKILGADKNPVVEGSIIFGVGEKLGTTYYTGKELPLYSSQTKWYVDEQGMISVEVGGVMYGEGEKSENPPSNNSMLQSWKDFDKTDFHADEYKNKISKVKFASSTNVPEGKIESWDVSQAKDESIMAWVESDENEGYVLTIVGKGKVVANTDSGYLFRGFKALKEIENIGLLDTSKVTNMQYMFSNCSSLTSLDISSFNTSEVTNMSGMFTSSSKLSTINLEGLDTSKVTDMSNIFWSTGFSKIDFLNNFNTSNVTNMYGMFGNCKNLTSINLEGLDTSKVTNMSYMFSENTNLQTINLEGLDISKVTDMKDMFYNCQNLVSVSMQGLDATEVTNMQNMFYNCKKLSTLNMSNFNTKKVNNMRGMFNTCSSLTSIDLSSFNTSNVTDMNGLFATCSSLTSIDLSNFDTSNVTNIAGMFSNCSNLTSIDLSNFNTSKVTDMQSMFTGCISLTSTDLSNFDTSKVTDMYNMFNGCRSLTSLGNNIIFDTGKVNTSIALMFKDCIDLNTTILISSKNINTVNAFYNAAINPTAQITINYTAETASIVDSIIAAKPATSNIVKGVQI